MERRLRVGRLLAARLRFVRFLPVLMTGAGAPYPCRVGVLFRHVSGPAISLIGRVLTDVPLAALFAQVLTFGLARDVGLRSWILSWTFWAAVLLRHGRQFGHRFTPKPADEATHAKSRRSGSRPR